MRTIKYLSLICATLILFHSCKTAKVSSGPDLAKNITQLTAIPQNASFILEIKGKSLLQKGALNTPEQYKSWVYIEKQLKEEPMLYNVFNSILREESPFGISLENIYLYAIKDNFDDYGVFILNLNDKTKFEKELLGFGASIENMGQYRAVEVGGDAKLVWNNDILFLIMGYRADIDKITRFSATNSIVQNKDFLKFLAKKSDLGLWCRYDDLIEMMNEGLSTELADSVKNTITHINTTFNQGEVNTTVSFGNESGKFFWDKYNVYNSSFNKEVASYFPEKTFFSTIISVNPTGYINFMKDVFEMTKNSYGRYDYDDYEAYEVVEAEEWEDDGEYEYPVIAGVEEWVVLQDDDDEPIMQIWDDDDEPVRIIARDVWGGDDDDDDDDDDEWDWDDDDDDDDDYDYESYYRSPSNVVAEITNAIGEWAGYFGGDAVLNVYGFAQGIMPMPLVGLSFNVKNEDAFNKLLALVPEVNKSGDYYYISESFLVVYFAYRNNVVMVTNDSDLIQRFSKGQKETKNMLTNPATSNINNMASAMYFNLDLDSYPENIKIIVNQFIQSQTGFNSDIVTHFLKEVYLRGDKDNSGIFSIKLKDEKKNSLKSIFEMIDIFLVKELGRY